METETLTYTGKLVITSCWCGIQLAIPDSLYKVAQRDHKHGVYCPLGHSWVFAGQTEAERLKLNIKWHEDREARLVAELDQARASRQALKGQVTKLRNRAAAGACPFCGERVYQLARHVARKHADEAGQEAEE